MVRAGPGRAGSAERKKEPQKPEFQPSSKFLLEAIRDGDFSRAQGAILAGADVNADRDDHGYAALHLAVMKGLQGLVRLLLEHKADVNLPGGPYMTTPLHLIALSSSSATGTSGNRLLVKLLMDYKADASFLDADAGAIKEEPPPTVAKQPGPRRRRNPAGGFVRGNCGDAIVRAIQEGDTFKAQGLVLAGADINSARDARGNSPLHLACISGKPGLVKLLLSKSAEIDARTQSCYSTPLHLSIMHGHHQIVWTLLRSTATVNTSNIHGSTPLGLCILDGKLDIVRHIIEAKAQVALDTSGRAAALQDQPPDLNKITEESSAAAAAAGQVASSTFLTNGDPLQAPGAALPRIAQQPAQSSRDRQIIQEFINGGSTSKPAEGEEQAALEALADCQNAHLAQRLLETGNKQTFRTPQPAAIAVDQTNLLQLADDTWLQQSLAITSLATQMPRSFALDRQLHGKARNMAALALPAPPRSGPTSPSLTARIGVVSRGRAGRPKGLNGTQLPDTGGGFLTQTTGMSPFPSVPGSPNSAGGRRPHDALGTLSPLAGSLSTPALRR
eukprot:TRINITY_DN31601_c0_g1_i1.p1 TRINITY_DN31601_c0_g1~~TRINITY_DN31601_c0_g1_i1.p1  ORF type:complete len:559 (-),score=107.61 TRINITY_DN31601_c0_g1_i1:141-1817(-)